MSGEKKVAPLQAELAAFEREKSHLLKEHHGKFAVFKGDKYVDSYSTFELAYEEGVRRFGKEPFLVKQVLDEEPKQKAPALMLGLLRARP